jgi:hypothetical protein
MGFAPRSKIVEGLVPASLRGVGHNVGGSDGILRHMCSVRARQILIYLRPHAPFSFISTLLSVLNGVGRLIRSSQGKTMKESGASGNGKFRLEAGRMEELPVRAGSVSTEI